SPAGRLLRRGGPPGGSGRRAGARRRAVRLLAGLGAAVFPVVVLVVPLALVHRPHARKTCRRIAAALEKMRMPRTTTTPVESWAPTPSLSPRKTISAATTTFDRNDTTKTLSSKKIGRAHV